MASKRNFKKLGRLSQIFLFPPQRNLDLPQARQPAPSSLLGQRVRLRRGHDRSHRLQYSSWSPRRQCLTRRQLFPTRNAQPPRPGRPTPKGNCSAAFGGAAAPPLQSLFRQTAWVQSGLTKTFVLPGCLQWLVNFVCTPGRRRHGETNASQLSEAT